MADLSAYLVDIETSRPNPNNPLEVRKGDAPRTAFSKYNAIVGMLESIADGVATVSATEPTYPAPYMQWIDTSQSPALLKRRNAYNTEWITINDALEPTLGFAQLQAWKSTLAPTDVHAEPRYHSVIDLTGLPTDRFYPVWWTSGGNNWTTHRLTIARTYYEDQEKEPFGPGVGHIAGLFLEIETVGYQWSGDANFLQAKRLSQNYRKTVRQIRFSMKCSTVVPAPGTSLMAGVTSDCPVSSGCYLRGGLSYHVYSNHWEALQYTRQSGQVMVGEATDTSNNKSARWMAQSRTINDSFPDGDYNDFITPYNALLRSPVWERST